MMPDEAGRMVRQGRQQQRCDPDDNGKPHGDRPAFVIRHAKLALTQL
jgi:hypothetical protein